jgi:glycerophosphoryl diester phosphodiesterase
VRLTRDYPRVPARAFLAGGPLIIAHRGASLAEVEHSTAAYRRALAVGAEVLELDVHRARDGALVIAHDRDLGRALGVPMIVGEHDLAELRAAVAAAHPGVDPATLLPTLPEVLASFPSTRLNLELKDAGVALATDVAALLARGHDRDRVLVASFDGDALDAFRAASHGAVATSASPGEVARFLVCYLLEVPCRPAFEALQVPTSVRRSWPRLRLDRPRFIEFAHRHGLAVQYWTIDDAAEMAHLLAIGADGIMTDDPATVAVAFQPPPTG